MSRLRVLRPGPLSLLQDAGRHGWQHLGVAPGGVMDEQAAAWANRLLGNAWSAALLEIALGDVELLAEADVWLALTGAEAPAQVDGAPLLPWSRFYLRAGQRLRIGFARRGQRLYLAAPGGFHAGPVLGSCSTQLREGLGGLDGLGSALRAGELLHCSARVLPCPASVPWYWQARYPDELPLRVMVGGDAPAFGEAALAAFFTRPWQLSAQSDRMGARLCGEPLPAPVRQWSQGVGRGAIQVPPDGQPIILQADHQTMGGYPLLGWLHPQDLWRLAQCPAGQRLRFSRVGVAGVQAGLRRFYGFFRT